MIADQESDTSISFNSSTNDDDTLISFQKPIKDAGAIMVNLNEPIKDVGLIKVNLDETIKDVGLIKVNLNEPIKDVGLIKVNSYEPIQETGVKSETGFGRNLFKENPNLRRNNFSRSLAAGN